MFHSKEEENGTCSPSSLSLRIAVSSKTNYEKNTNIKKENTYSPAAGNIKKPILVVCTDDGNMKMANDKIFNTGNHPAELFVPLLHFRDVGFDSFEFATVSGKPVVLEMWAYPNDDDNVKEIHDVVKTKMEHPKKIKDIPSIEPYAAIFIPGGHGCMINLPQSKDLGLLLHEAHEKQLPTITLCHGPGALLSTEKVTEKGGFAYDGYKTCCFTDATDSFTPMLGYLPGKMPWKPQSALTSKGMKVQNWTETGYTTQYKELITGDSPNAANNLGRMAAPILVKHWAEKPQEQ